ncbi:MAG: LemA family protein [Bacilli bacterium]|nr:LemA family protein [Bacilli bacterium]
MEILIVVLVIVALLAIFVIATYNKFINLRNKVEEAFSTMDVYLKKRWDLIPNLVETVKGYAKHEEETLKEIVNLRSSAYDNMSADEKVETNQQLSAGLSKLIALAENYPDLKANQNFSELSKELSSLEDEIASSRKYYNAIVRKYNDKVQMVPSNIIAKMFNFASKKMFEVNETERENVKVQF